MAQKAHRCQICGAEFDSEVELESHNRTTHSQYKCEACGQTFNSESQLTTHYRISHPEDIPGR